MGMTTSLPNGNPEFAQVHLRSVTAEGKDRDELNCGHIIRKKAVLVTQAGRFLDALPGRGCGATC